MSSSLPIRLSGPGIALLVTLLIGAGPVGAQEARPDTAGVEVRPSEPIPVDTLATLSLAPEDTIPILAPRFREGGGRESLAGVPSEDLLPRNPRNAAIRSFLLPGWGQFYTGHPYRGVAFAVAEVGFFTLGYRKQQQVLDQRDEIDRLREAFFADPPEGAPEDSLALLDLFEQSEDFLNADGELEDMEERRNDWYAYGMLSIIFAAVDAYAAAQLDPVNVGVDPVERRVWGGVRLPVGGPPDHGGGP